MGKYDKYKHNWYEEQKIKKANRCTVCGKPIGINSKSGKCGSCSSKERNKKFPPPSQKNSRHKYMDGVKNPNYKDGLYKIISMLRNCPEYREWRKKIFEQDNYTCQKCNKHGGYLQAHHCPIPFCILVRSIKTYEEGRQSKIIWKAKGKTLCKKCHGEEKQFYGNQYN